MAGPGNVTFPGPVLGAEAHQPPPAPGPAKELSQRISSWLQSPSGTSWRCRPPVRAGVAHGAYCWPNEAGSLFMVCRHPCDYFHLFGTPGRSGPLSGGAGSQRHGLQTACSKSGGGGMPLELLF